MERVCTHRQEGTLWAGAGEWAPAPDFSRTPPAPLQSPGSSLALSLAALRSPGTVGLSQHHRLPLPLGCPVFCLAALGWGVEGTLNRLGAGGRGPLPHSTGVPSPLCRAPALSLRRALSPCAASQLSLGGPRSCVWTRRPVGRADVSRGGAGLHAGGQGREQLHHTPPRGHSSVQTLRGLMFQSQMKLETQDFMRNLIFKC